jgi:hypothetical protein
MHFMVICIRLSIVAGWYSKLCCVLPVMLTQELLLLAGVSQLPAAHCTGVKLEQHWAQWMSKERFEWA